MFALVALCHCQRPAALVAASWLASKQPAASWLASKQPAASWLASKQPAASWLAGEDVCARLQPFLVDLFFLWGLLALLFKPSCAPASQLAS